MATRCQYKTFWGGAKFRSITNTQFPAYFISILHEKNVVIVYAKNIFFLSYGFLHFMMFIFPHRSLYKLTENSQWSEIITAKHTTFVKSKHFAVLKRWGCHILEENTVKGQWDFHRSLSTDYRPNGFANSEGILVGNFFSRKLNFSLLVRIFYFWFGPGFEKNKTQFFLPLQSANA